MRRALLLAVVVLAVGASGAGATTPPEEAAPSIELPSVADPLDSPILRGAEAVAEEYWASHGVALPSLQGVYRLPAEARWAGVSGFSELPGSRIWLAREDLEVLHSALHQFNVRSRAILCYTVIHERGHNAGLLHTDAAVFPIMAMSSEVEGGGWLRKEVAPRCWTWAKHPFAS